MSARKRKPAMVSTGIQITKENELSKEGFEKKGWPQNDLFLQMIW